LEAFDTLFNKRDYPAAKEFWSSQYIQHSAHIAPRREGLFDLTKSLPPTLKYEPGTIVAEGNFVIVHGRFSNFGLPVNWIAADILRIEKGHGRAIEKRRSYVWKCFPKVQMRQSVKVRWSSAIGVGCFSL
jgi:predicted SnoaL-like aldol condensation-catalyzing enzyme